MVIPAVPYRISMFFFPYYDDRDETFPMVVLSADRTGSFSTTNINNYHYAYSHHHISLGDIVIKRFFTSPTVQEYRRSDAR